VKNGKTTPARVAGHVNPAVPLSLGRAPAEALRLVLKMALQRKMKESMGEAMGSRKHEIKPGSLRTSICQS